MVSISSYFLAKSLQSTILTIAIGHSCCCHYSNDTIVHPARIKPKSVRVYPSRSLGLTSGRLDGLTASSDIKLVFCEAKSVYAVRRNTSGDRSL
jgi:hypothetical protein